MTEILIKAIVGLLLGGICGYFIALRSLPFVGRNSSKGVSVGFDLNLIAIALFVLILGILGGAIIGLIIALWLTT